MKMGLRIAICDDAAKDRAAIRAALGDRLAVRGVRADVEMFSHPDALLKAARARPFDLYLLDVIMPMVDGLSVARELRGFQEQAPIVFLTASRDHALEAFGVRALDYVVKPWERSRLEETLLRGESVQSVKSVVFNKGLKR